MKLFTTIILLAAVINFAGASPLEKITISLRASKISKSGNNDDEKLAKKDICNMQVTTESGKETTLRIVEVHRYPIRKPKTKADWGDTDVGYTLTITPIIVSSGIEYNAKLRIVEPQEISAENGIYSFMEASAILHDIENDGGQKFFTMKSPKGETIEFILQLSTDITKK